MWFGENLPELHWLAAREAAKDCDVLLCVGTSLLVYPAASLVTMVIERRATTVLVNPNPTDRDASVTAAIQGPAGAVLPRLVAKAWGPSGCGNCAGVSSP